MDVLTMWLLYSVFGVSVFSLLFLWAVRNRQFADQDRARHLALHSPEHDAAHDLEGD
jgi:cbb3-type cytochrome oxidase maturation protein